MGKKLVESNGTDNTHLEFGFIEWSSLIAVRQPFLFSFALCKPRG